jgi:signal peptidase I
MAHIKTKNKTQKKKKGFFREWFDAILFAVIAATLIRWVFMEAFTIPTPSMEKSLLVGDFLFVSKLHYGPRTPKTPLQVPLTHQKIWGTDIPSYTDLIQLPQYRLPGFSEVERNDVVVFNYPGELHQHPVDLRQNYIKRCVGIAGDTIKIVDKMVYINGEKAPVPEGMQTSYIVKTKENISTKVFDRFDITDVGLGYDGYLVMTNEERAKQLEQLDFITEVKEYFHTKENSRGNTFPQNANFDWTVDNFGPLYIPKEGATIPINEENLILYGRYIKHYEGLDADEVEIDGATLKISGNAISEYTFKQDYYFMMGDNRHNSEDSRIWGFVPMDHIIGEGVIVWWSIEPGGLGDMFERIRWGRIFKLIE